MPDSTSSSSHGGSQTSAAAAAPSGPQVDLTHIEDPHVRRAIRAVAQYSHGVELRLRQQQQEIEALLQMMIEKHVGSLGEFKRHLLKLQQGDVRGGRIHDQIAAATAPPPPAAAAAAPPRVERPARPAATYADPEVDRPRRYTL
jgi:hypothetical protein